MGGPMRRRLILGAMTLILAGCLIAPPGNAHSSGDEVIEVDVRGVKVKFPDIVVRDQDGRKVRFYSDLIKDKVVVLSFFYTSCVAVCTRQGRVFTGLQSLLGERLGKSVFMILVTTDPATDDPRQLKAWAERYKVGDGWTLVTGDVAEMNKLLVPFTGNKAGGGMHIPSTFIANDGNGKWTSAVGVFEPNYLLDKVNSLTLEPTR